MKRIFLVTAMVILCLHGISQTKLQVIQDSVRVLNSELILRNGTRSVPGFLFNKGNGVTEFRQALTKINDSIYLVGIDTLKMSPGIGRLILDNGFMRSGDTLRLGGSLNQTTVVNMNKQRLTFNLTDGTTPYKNESFWINAVRDTVNAYNDLFVVHKQTGAVMESSQYSRGAVFTASVWSATDSFPSGYFPNYVSHHKSSVNAKMNSTTILGFASYSETKANEKWGTFTHFYASPAFNSKEGVTQTVNGLLIDTLKGINTANSYAIRTIGLNDSIYNAGPVRWPKYKNTAAADSILTTDSLGNIKLRAATSAGVNLSVQTLKDSTTVAWNVSKGANGSVKLGGTGRTIDIISPVAGQTYKLEIVQDSIGSRTITSWPAGTVWPAGVAPTLSAAASSTDLVTLYYSGSKYFGSYQLFNRPNTNVSILSYDAKAQAGASTHNLSGVPAGAVLVLCTGQGSSSLNATVTSSPSLTWTKRVDASAATGSGDAEIYTAIFAAGGTIAVTSSWGANEQSSVCYTIINQEATIGGANNKAVSQATPSVSLTTTRANSLIICYTSDWNARDSTRTYRSATTETQYRNSSGNFTSYGYYLQAITVSSYTVGLT
ncbi:MAG TPA: hypothetical protein VK644_03400, partial [Chitinophagaceae bacterium]|nr:hypothetical protein [Chitinophagaceae bacterium]